MVPVSPVGRRSDGLSAGVRRGAHAEADRHRRAHETVSFKVSAGDEYAVDLNMSAGSRLEFRFTSDLDINFQLLGRSEGSRSAAIHGSARSAGNTWLGTQGRTP